jgi:hypothetical protein
MQTETTSVASRRAPEQRAPHAYRVGLHRRRAQDEPDCVATAQHFDLQGVSLAEPPSAVLGRYVWLDLDVDEGEPVRALGEVMGPSPASELAWAIRFKHLFPDQRKRLIAAMARDEG